MYIDLWPQVKLKIILTLRSFCHPQADEKSWQMRRKLCPAQTLNFRWLLNYIDKLQWIHIKRLRNFFN